MIRVYYKSDYKIREVFKTSSGDTIDPRTLNFSFKFIAGRENTFTCSHTIGAENEWVNCKYDSVNNAVLCMLDNHNLLPGRLKRELTIEEPDSDFPDGKLDYITYKAYDIELVETPDGDSLYDIYDEEIVVTSGVNPVELAEILHESEIKDEISDNDEFNYLDSEDDFKIVKITFTKIKAFFKTFFDTIYASTTHNHNLNDLAEKSYNSLTDTPSLDFEPANENIQSHIGDEDIHVTSLQKEDFHAHTNKTALDAVKGVNTGDQSSSDFDIKDLSDTTSLRSTWSGKQDALTFSTDIETDKASTTKVSAIKTFYDWAVGKFIDLTKIVTTWTATTLNTNIPSEKLVKDSLNLKADLSGGNTFSGNQNFDSNTLFVDSVNHRVGVGNNAPTKSFHVSGDIINTGNYISSGNDIQIQMHYGNSTVFRGVRAATAWIDSQNTQWFQIGNENDYVAFTSKKGLPIKRYGIFASTTQISPSSGANVPTGLFEISDKTNPLFNVLLNGNVGIGTTTPAAKLDVNGTSNFADNMNMLSTKNQYLAASPTSDTVNDIRVRNDSGVLKTERCTVANATKGAGTWVDESKADITPATGATSALRALYIARSWNRAAGAGAERYELSYNSATGYYEMYGINDLTEADVAEIYNASIPLSSNALFSSDRNLEGVLAYRNCRTNFPLNYFASHIQCSIRYLAQGNKKIEKFIHVGYYGLMQPGNIAQAFYGCIKLNEVSVLDLQNITTTDVVSNVFRECPALITVSIKNLKVSFSFEWSPLLSLASLQYLVNNRANGTTRITITVHADVWAKLNDAVGHADWNALLVDAVANQYIDFASA